MGAWSLRRIAGSMGSLMCVEMCVWVHESHTECFDCTMVWGPTSVMGGHEDEWRLHGTTPQPHHNALVTGQHAHATPPSVLPLLWSYHFFGRVLPLLESLACTFAAGAASCRALPAASQRCCLRCGPSCIQLDLRRRAGQWVWRGGGAVEDLDAVGAALERCRRGVSGWEPD
jgi:hypothetical protein